jgi:hypothetical protein
MICLMAGTIAASLAVNAVTLAWTHSIEKIRWEEDWYVEAGALQISEARVRGSGAGMEAPPYAVLHDGVWHYRPPLAPQESLRLTHSLHTAGYELCFSGQCQPLAQHLPGIDNYAVIDLRACP